MRCGLLLCFHGGSPPFNMIRQDQVGLVSANVGWLLNRQGNADVPTPRI
jgi:hypothetical protein